MRLIAMSATLSAAIIAYSAVDVSVPILSTLSRSGEPVRALSAASASVPPGQAAPARVALPVVFPGAEAAHARGYAIPADHPHPPLGRFKLTAYSGPQGGRARAITATGTSARAGRTVAVDPTVIPLGSRIFIEGIGERIAEDVGGGVKGNHIDVYLPSVPQATRFGVKHRRTVSVVAARSTS
jgi:3D (Asp-Asp-Asp) domain-containing protein